MITNNLYNNLPSKTASQYYEERDNSFYLTQIATNYNEGEIFTIETPIVCRALAFAIKAGTKIIVNGVNLEIYADAAQSATQFFITATTLETALEFDSIVSIDQKNLFLQYQDKTEGTVAGFDIDTDGMSKGGVEITGWLDSDTMEGATANNLPTAESVKAYVDAQVGASDTLQEVTDNGNTTTNSITFAGGTSSDDLTISSESPVLKIDASSSGNPEIFFARGAGDDQNSRIKLSANQLKFENAGDPDSTYLFQGRAAGSGSLSDFLKIEDTGITTTGGVFTDQVTIPVTPIATTDAASKSYVDGQAGHSETLQEVTDNGSITTNNIMIGSSSSPITKLVIGGVNNVQGLSLEQQTNNSDYSARLFFGSNNKTCTLVGRAGGFAFNTNSVINSTTGSEKMRITSDGNVGIGTTSPDTKLDVVGAGPSVTFRLSNSTSDNTTKYGAILGRHYSNSEEDVSGMLITSSSNSTAQSVIIGGGISGVNAVNIVAFYTGADYTTLVGTERMRINDTGNVGIGTSSPETNLHVNSAGGSGVTTQIKVTQEDDGSGHPGADAILQSSGWGEAYLKLSTHQISAAGGDMNIRPANSADLVFYGGGSEKMRLIPDGNLLIGSTANNGGKLQVEGDIRLSNSAKIFLWQSHSANYLQYYRWEASTGNLMYINNEGSGGVGIKTGSTERMRVTSGGNILIGTTTDSGYKLDVNGTQRVQRTLELEDVLTLNAISTPDDPAVGKSSIYMDSADGAIKVKINFGEEGVVTRTIASYEG